MLDCDEYEDLRQRMLDVVSRTLKEATTNRDREREKDGGREKENHGGSDGRVVYLRTRPESSSAAFLQAGNETQKHYRSGRVGFKDIICGQFLILIRASKRGRRLHEERAKVSQ